MQNTLQKGWLSSCFSVHMLLVLLTKLSEKKTTVQITFRTESYIHRTLLIFLQVHLKINFKSSRPIEVDFMKKNWQPIRKLMNFINNSCINKMNRYFQCDKNVNKFIYLIYLVFITLKKDFLQGHLLVLLLFKNFQQKNTSI